MSYHLHPSVVVDGNVELLLGAGVLVEPFVYIGCSPLFVKGATAREKDHPGIVKIGRFCKVGSHATIYRDVEIGEGCLIGTGAVIREGVRIGSRCVIGCGVEVNYETVIGNDCRIMSQTHLTGRMVIGDGSFFGVGVNTSNDRRIDLDDYEYRQDHVAGPQIGRKVMVGTGANLLAGITIGDGALIGSGALVTKDVPAGARAISKGAVAAW